MKFLSTLVLLATLSVFTEALHHDHVHRSPHNRLMRRGGNGGGGRCRQRPPQVNQNNSGDDCDDGNNPNGPQGTTPPPSNQSPPPSQQSPPPSQQSPPPNNQSPPPNNQPDDSGDDCDDDDNDPNGNQGTSPPPNSQPNNAPPPSPSPAPSPAPSPNPAPNQNPPPSPSPSPSPTPNTSPAPSNPNGVIQVQDNSCGSSGATQQVTQTTGPNGAIDWMNCGVNGGGWTPPHVQVTDLITVELNDAISQGGPFTACSSFVWAFEQYGNQYGLPPILLASIALQESSCNPATVGGNGEQGLMQLTSDKCGDAPGGNCQDIGYNIMTGAKYFSGILADNNGSFFMALGTYNGWIEGMTVAYATRMQNTACHAQNNLDYLHQTVNGWLQNQDAYALHLGEYFNLANC